MLGRRLLAVLASLALQALAPASEALIVPSAQTRFVASRGLGNSWEGYPTDYSDEERARDFSPFSGRVRGAEQTSSITAQTLEVSMTAFARGAGDISLDSYFFDSAQSTFELAFTLPVDVEYELDITLSSPDNPAALAIGVTHFVLQEASAGSSERLLFLDCPHMYCGPQTITGSLEAGDYVVRAIVVSFSYDAFACCADARIHFTFSVVPEPSSALLLAGGLTTIATRSWRQGNPPRRRSDRS